MDHIKEAKAVKVQYFTSKNLDTRINIHSRYSVNKQGFGNWIYEQYTLLENSRILELGCGNGDMWLEKYKKLPLHSHLILTDMSEGMLDETKKIIGIHDNISYECVDIQNMPYEDNSMDIVIANMMLYHVPDIGTALREVKRVLKENGHFYCATYGENGIIQYIQECLADFGVQKVLHKDFTLQCGEEILREHFSKIEKRIYEDALEVTDSNDLIEYMLSLTSIMDLSEIPRSEIYDVFESRKINGSIHIPKEYGMFIVTK